MNDLVNKDDVINLILDVSDNPYLSTTVKNELKCAAHKIAMQVSQIVTCGECAHRHESEFCECRPDDFFCADGERNETKLANYYNELIVNLEAAGEWERLGELSDHDRSNLYFQAANAIRQLRKERERCEGCAKATREVIGRLQDRIVELMEEKHGH